MLQTIALFNSISTAYQANYPLKSTVGELIAGWEKQNVSRPYGIVEIKPTETEYLTGNLYIQTYRITITTWNTESIGSAYAIGAAFYSLFNVYYKFTNLTDNAKTLQVISLPLQVVPEEERDIDVTSGMPTEVFKIVCEWDAFIDEVRNT